jgi:hypothetical protein
LVLLAQRCRDRADQVEQRLAAWRDVGAVLNVAIGPVSNGKQSGPRIGME